MIRRQKALRWGAELAVAAVIALLAWSLYGRAGGFWWTHDDFFQLSHAAEHRPAEYVLDPAVWQRLPNRMLTPLLFVSLDVDLALFGPSPRPFHLHQVAALALAAVALYGLLRLWTTAGWSAFAAVLFLLGPPVTSLASLLMVRHYVEGLLLFTLALAAYAIALRRRNWRWSAVSAVLYLAAMAAKEVFVPLGLLLPLLPEASRGERLRRAAPHLAALGGYLLYRVHMLGELLGGYGWAPRWADLPALAVALPGRFASLLAGGAPAAAWAAGGAPAAGRVAAWALAAGWIAVALALLAAVAAAVRSRRAAVVSVATAVVVLAPILPVSAEMEPRFAVVGWAALALGAAIAGSRWGAPAPGAPAPGPPAPGPPASGPQAAAGRTVWIAAAALLFAAFVANRGAWAETSRRMNRLEVEDRAILALGPGDLLYHPAEPPAALDALPAFAARLLGDPVTAGRFSDDLFLCTGGAVGKRVWRYRPAEGRLLEITGELPQMRRRYCSSLRRRAPLAAVFEPAAGTLRWRLGPYRDGEYRVVLDRGVRSIAVPRIGGYRLRRNGELRLRVRYRHPTGWVTYSPELAIDLGADRGSVWRRGAGRP